MKTKLKESIKPLLADNGLKDKEIEKIAEYIISVKGLKEESTDDEIKDAIGDGSSIKSIAALVQMAASRGDAEATARLSKKYEGWIDPTKQTPPTLTPTVEPTQTEPKVDEIPAYLKKFMDEQAAENKRLRERLDSAESRRNAEHLSAVYNADKRIQAIPKFYTERYTLDKEENLEDLVKRVEGDWAKARQELYKRDDFAEPPSNVGGYLQGSESDLIKSFERMSRIALESKK